MKGEVAPIEELTIERLVPGGPGLARRASGEVVMVPGAYPGDRVGVLKCKRRSGVEHVEAFTVLTPCTERVESPCTYSEECGGCDLISLGVTAQKRVKEDIVRQALKRTGGIEVQDIEWLGSERSLQYRERIRLQIVDGRLGFFSRSSQRLVLINLCLVAHESLNEAIQRLQELVVEDPSILLGLSSIEIRVLSNPGQGNPQLLLVQIHPITASTQVPRSIGRPGRGNPRSPMAHPLKSGPLPPALSEVTGRLGRALPAGTLLRVARQRVDPLRDYVSGRAWVYFRPGQFSQVNPQINRLIIDRLIQVAQERESKTFLDLYCGSGNFSIPLLAQGLSGTGVEFDAEAIEMAQRSMAEQSTSHWGVGKFLAMDTAHLENHSGLQKSYDLVIVDPPRAGAKSVLHLASRLCADLLFMVSCDPVTLARDLKFLLSTGFELKSVIVCDMFPQTHHVETVAILEKAAPKP